ncbi:MerR family transcriptional regulator [Planobispora siamensis]|uniref:HTH merR-type domain-containing protein n=1 Tax=Planobispora siamensis TaxID=936338 RepID=A0A8J3SWL3_9ACTN|nr:MerR family transcriptional regulator [Planobispora siamensis]GIH96868.1 hypothetical protein Psi01_74980 [Planobispora siamensis]
MNEDLERGPGGDLMSIGRFARLCRLSVKQLRNYADLGLLEPAWVDPDTGYRYYRAGQVRDALSIGLLRSLDVPLAVIGEVLSGTAAARALGRVRDDLEAELARRRRTLATLERVLADGIPAAPVDVVTEPARRVVMARDVAASTGDVGRAVSACVARLAAALPDAPGDPGPARLIGLFPVEPDEPLPVAVALEVPGAVPGSPAAAPDPPPGIVADLLPGGDFARVTHVGPYDQITLSYHALLAWCAERGHPVRGPVREVYLSDPATTPPERLVTDLMIRLEEPP